LSCRTTGRFAPDTHPYIIVEKILTRGEALRGDWEIDGTTGYDFMDQVGALLHKPEQVWPPAEQVVDGDGQATTTRLPRM
jgi:(1->4)-alpha-D-glucan 1-alpha-D-glucosylmutase